MRVSQVRRFNASLPGHYFLESCSSLADHGRRRQPSHEYSQANAIS